MGNGPLIRFDSIDDEGGGDDDDDDDDRHFTGADELSATRNKKRKSWAFQPYFRSDYAFVERT